MISFLLENFFSLLFKNVVHLKVAAGTDCEKSSTGYPVAPISGDIPEKVCFELLLLYQSFYFTQDYYFFFAVSYAFSSATTERSYAFLYRFAS